MKAPEVVNACFSAIEARDFAKAGGLLSDELHVSGVAPKPLGKSDFLTVHRALSSGIPDFKFHY